MNYPSFYEANFAARYAARAHQLSAKAWRKLTGLLSFIELLGGSAAFAAYFSKNPALTAYVGLVLALCVAINYTLHPVDKAKDEELLHQRFMRLLSQHGLSLTDFNQRLGELCSESDHELDAFRYIAYNDVAKEFGRDDYAFKLTWFQKLVSIL